MGWQKHATKTLKNQSAPNWGRKPNNFF